MENIDTIVEMLEQASEAYYNGSPVISDQEFDALKDKLTLLDPSHPFLEKVGAPVTVGAWPKRKHASFMGSQNKVNEKHEFDHWHNDMIFSVASGEKDERVAVSHKLDGSTIVLTYEEGVLKHATTRGDGEEGEVITKNALKMMNVKANLPEPFSGDLRGEVMLETKPFLRHFKTAGYKNARNSANGCARDKKGGSKLGYLKVIYFDVLPANPNFFYDHMDGTEKSKQDLVEQYGLEYVHTEYMTYDEVWEYFEKFDRAALPYGIDGLICKVMDLREQEVFGITSGRPNGQIAIKFESPTAKTVVNDITWQMGLSGRVTPVAELEPFDLDGVTISRSTLNNLDYIAALGLEIGDEVVVARLNDVIPGIIEVATKSNSGKGINQPTTCPSCGNVLERDGAYVICPFVECAGAVFGNMAVWIRTQNILGFGPSTISSLIELGVATPDKLYTVDEKTLAEACGSDKTAKKLKAGIDKTKEMPLNKFLTGLNIPHLGKTNGKRLMKEFGTLDAVLTAPAEEMAQVEGIKTTAKKIVTGLAGKRSLIDKLLKSVEIVDVSGPLSGKSFAMTGLRSHKGHDIAELISTNGGDAKSGVSKGLNYLIIKDPNSTSNKAEKARKYGTKLISPDEFLDMVGV
jgi:DNA ligase (NAD+)